MSDLINGRTPEEIKTSLRMCSEICFGRSDCPYYDGVNEKCQTKLTFDALALIKHLESERDAALAKVPRWISVEDMLPENFRSVIILRDDVPNGGLSEVGWRIGEYWSVPNGVKVTHWMPLPEPPKEGE